MYYFVVERVDVNSNPPQHYRDAAIGDDLLDSGRYHSAHYRPEPHIFPRHGGYEAQVDVYSSRQGHGHYYNEELPYGYGESAYHLNRDTFPPRSAFQAVSGGFYEQPHPSAPPQTFLRHGNVGSNFLVPRDVFQTGPRYFDQSPPSAYYGRNNFNYETDYYASRQTSVNRCMYPLPPNAVFYDVQQDNRFLQQDNRFRHSNNFM